MRIRKHMASFRVVHAARPEFGHRGRQAQETVAYRLRRVFDICRPRLSGRASL
ncbi:MAG: hypothetical protein AABZ18_00350 [Pseudomonadota bacterium]